MGKWYQLDRRYGILYIKLAVLSLLYVFPVILANVYYNDDLARSLYGATGWSGDGRPLGEALMLFLCGGEPVSDIAPLPLILSVFLLSYVLVLYARANLDSVFDETFLLCILLFVITNPFAVVNISYRFDCIIMFSALSLSFLIFAMPDTLPGVWLFICSFLAGAAVMSLYQAVIGLCIALFIIHLFYAVLGAEKAAVSGAWRMAGIGAGAIFYKLVIAGRYVSSTDWRYEASRVVGFAPESVKIVLDNIVNACRYIKGYVAGISRVNQVSLILFCLGSVGAVLYLYIRDRHKKGVVRTGGILFLLVSPVLAAVSTFLPLMVLSALTMRSRIFIAFGVSLLYVGIMLLCCCRKYGKLRRAAIALTAVCVFFHFTFMYSYGNALKSQDEYQKYLVYHIAHDLEEINGEGSFQTVSFAGQPPKARQVQKICLKYPFMNELIPVYLDNDTWIGGAWLYHYLQYDLTIGNMEESDWEVVQAGESALNNSVYSCYLNGTRIIVHFH